MLRVDGLMSGYGQVQVLWGVSFEVRTREIVCLIGSNGAGKTTLLHTISGIVPAWSGQVDFHGENLARIPAHDVVTRGIAHVPEGRRLFRTMSVRDNLLMGAYRSKDRASQRADLDRVYALFPILAERRTQAAGTLSGGEQQMCAIGRGLMSKPKLLLIDELSLGLAPRVVDTLATTMAQIRELGISVLLVEQDVTVAFELADRGLLLDAGKISVAASTADLAEHPQVRVAYMGS
jgi:branched-chain amino acid transport system ATP-binding protein